MKTGALILGIIGGLVALIYGLFGYVLGNLGDVMVLKIVSVGLPIAGLVGAGMVKSRTVVGAILMGITAVGFLLILGFNFFTFFPVILLGLAAVLGFLGYQQEAKKITKP